MFLSQVLAQPGLCLEWSTNALVLAKTTELDLQTLVKTQHVNVIVMPYFFLQKNQQDEMYRSLFTESESKKDEPESECYIDTPEID